MKPTDKMVVWKKVTLSIASLLVFVLLFEGLLRMVDFEYYPVNPGFNLTGDYRMFQPQEQHYVTSKEAPQDCVHQGFAKHKPGSQYRIFVLGGSSVYFLDDLEHLKRKLENTAPDKEIRIINVGCGGYGSNRVFLRLQEVVQYQPYLLIVYSGHNEFADRYILEYIRNKSSSRNALSLASDELLENSKLYQLLSMGTSKATGLVAGDNLKTIAKMKPYFGPQPLRWFNFTFNEKEKEAVWKNYQDNLEQMTKYARNHQVDIIISTVAYNRMIPPHQAPGSQYQKCRQLYQQERFDEAAECFAQALDRDLSPHRATQTSNAIVKGVAKKFQVPLADVDKAVVEAAEHHTPGGGLFMDYCHLNNKGNQILQEELYQTIKENALLK